MRFNETEIYPPVEYVEFHLEQLFGLKTLTVEARYPGRVQPMTQELRANLNLVRAIVHEAEEQNMVQD